MKDKKSARLLALALTLAGSVFAAVDDHSHPHPRPEAVQPHDIVIPSELWDRLEFNALLELEAFAAETDGASESDLTLATVEITLDADVNEGTAAHLGLLWEEDVTEENILDEGYLTLGATEVVPFYLTAGKMYLTVGVFESVFISDPLTLELAETRESAAMVGYANDWIDLNAGAFNGDFDAHSDKSVDDAFASIAFTPGAQVAVGAYWLSDLLETDGLADFTTSALGAGFDFEATGAAGAYLHAHVGPVAFSAEYITALDKIELPAGRLQPSAYHLEVSMPVHEKVSVGAKLEGSSDFYADLGADKWADDQAGLVVSYSANANVTLSGEYLHAEGLDDDSSADQITVQVSLVL